MLLNIVTATTILYNSYLSLKSIKSNSTELKQQCLKLYILLSLNSISAPHSPLLYYNQRSAIHALNNMLNNVPMYNTIRTLITIALLIPSQPVRRMLYDVTIPYLLLLQQYCTYHIIQCRNKWSTATLYTIESIMKQSSVFLLPYINDSELSEFSDVCTSLQLQCKSEQTKRLALSMNHTGMKSPINKIQKIALTLNNSMTLPAPAAKAGNTVQPAILSPTQPSIQSTVFTSNSVHNDSHSELYDVSDSVIDKENVDNSDNYDDVLTHVSKRQQSGMKDNRNKHRLTLQEELSYGN